MSTTSQWWPRSFSSGTVSSSFAQFATIQSGITNVISSTDTQAQAPVSAAGNLLTLKVDLGTAPGTGKSWRVQVSINNTPNTTLDVTVSDSATSGSATGTVALSAGDLVSLKITPSGTPAATKMCFFTEFDPTTANHYTYPNSGSQAFATAPSYVRGIGARANYQATDSLSNGTRDVVPFAGTITDLYVYAFQAPGVGKSFDVILMRNGSEEASTAINIAGASQAGNVTGLNIAVAAGDYLTFKYKQANGGPTNGSFAFSITIVPTVSGMFAIPGATASSLAATTQYLGQEGFATSALQSGTEADIQFTKAPAILALRALYVLTETAAGSGKTRTFQQRINTANGTLVASLSNTTTGNDAVHTDITASGDVLNLAYTADASTTSSAATAWAVAASTSNPITVTPSSSANIVATGATPTVAVTDNKTVAPSGAAETLTPATPVVGVGQTLVPSAAALTTTPATPTVVLSDNKLLTPSAAAVTLTRATPEVGGSQTLAPSVRSLTLTPDTPTVTTAIAPVADLPAVKRTDAQRLAMALSGILERDQI